MSCHVPGTQEDAQSLTNTKLFKRQGEYFDIPSSTLTPIQIRQKLHDLATEVIGTPEGFADLLALKSTPNGGNAVTEELKYTSKP
jgi:hypothetical protein